MHAGRVHGERASKENDMQPIRCVCQRRLLHGGFQRSSMCKIPGCKSETRQEGRCTRHGAKRLTKICSEPGCT
jgi:hypothetical protein